MVKVGAWEGGIFIGCVLFANGANPTVGNVYQLKQTEICELVRVALNKHLTPVSRIIAIVIRFLKQSNPGLKMIVSYADPEQGHVGGIYQAGNWVYVGIGSSSRQYFHEGRWKHSREVTSGAFGGKPKIADYSHLRARVVPGKYKYLMPLDDDMKKGIAVLAKPYPKPICATSVASDAPGVHPGEGGAVPTVALQNQK